MKIYLDFDGTCVEHAYPKMGRCNFGSIEVIKRLQDAGHEVILNTMRSEIQDNSLVEAMEWFKQAWRMLNGKHDEAFNLSHISTTTKKLHPLPWDLEEAIAIGELYIDDIASGIPLKKAAMTNGYMVDWQKVGEQYLKLKRRQTMPYTKSQLPARINMRKVFHSIAPNVSGLNAVEDLTAEIMNEGMNINNSTKVSTKQCTRHCRFSPCYTKISFSFFVRGLFSLCSQNFISL